MTEQEQQRPQQQCQSPSRQAVAMENCRRLQLSLFFLRLVGGFPYQRRENNEYMKTVTQVYTQTHVIDAGPRRAAAERPPRYQARAGWRVWTWCLGLILVCFVTLIAFEVPNVTTRYSSWPMTLTVANRVREMITSVTVLVTEVYLLTSSSRAVETANQYLDLLPDSRRSSATLLTDVCVVVCGVLFLGGISLILTAYVYYLTYNGICGYIFYVITQHVEIILYLLINCSVISYLYTVILLFCSVFEKIKRQLVEASSKCYVGEDVNLHKIILKMYECEASVQPSDTETDFTTHRRPNTKANKGSDDLPRTAKHCRRTLTQLHLLQYSLNRYLGLPITLIMFTSIVYSILACFYMSFMFFLTNAMRVMSVAYLLIGVLPQILLSNMPVLLQTQVRPTNIHAMPI